MDNSPGNEFRHMCVILQQTHTHTRSVFIRYSFKFLKACLVQFIIFHYVLIKAILKFLVPLSFNNFKKCFNRKTWKLNLIRYFSFTPYSCYSHISARIFLLSLNVISSTADETTLHLYLLL